MSKNNKLVNKNHKTIHKPRKNVLIRSKLKWLIIFGYLLYLFLILMTQLPFIAEHFASRTIYDSDVIESHLSFPADGRQSHYYVELSNQSMVGYIDVYYYPKSNTLRTKVENIKSLTIYCRSMYYDECKDVFGIDPNDNSNYYKWYFIEKNHLNVNIDSNNDLETLKFIDAPQPSAVYVDGVQWTEPEQYQYLTIKGIALSNVSAGSTNVDLYFKSTPDSAPVAMIIASRAWLVVNQTLSLDGSGSYDIDPDGEITNYIWDFGDGNFSTGESIVNYSYIEPKTYGIILTVVDNDLNIGHAYCNVTVTSSTNLTIQGIVPHITLLEDSPTCSIQFRDYEPYSDNPNDDFYWYFTGENLKLYSISGENSSEDKILITPKRNQFGNDFVVLWLENNEGDRVCQPLWVNITPINDPPIIFGIPDITIHYDVPYEFNYLLYIHDVDTPLSALVINTSDPIHTTVTGFNVTYVYPKSMVGETVYVILTIWDGNRESSDVIAVWITDDWVPNLVTPLPDVYLDEGEVYLNYFDLDDYFMDPDNDTLYYSYGYTHVNVVINEDHTVDFYAPNDWNGEEMTTFRATDPSGALIEDIITVIVRPINDPPIIQNIPNLIVRYNLDYVFDVKPYVYDEDTPLNELLLTTDDPAHIRIDENNPLIIILNYPYRSDIPYTKTVKVSISDGMNTSFQFITVYVKDNYPPILVNPFKEITIYEDVPKINAMNLYDYFDDNDSSMFLFKVVNNNKVTSKIHVNGSLDLGNEPNWSGHETITIRCLDPDLAIAEGKLEVHVIPVNDPPEISDIPVQKFNQTEKHILNLQQYLFDIDNNITELKLWLEDCEIDFEIHGRDIIFYATKPITTTVTLYVSDGEAQNSQKILIEVSGKELNQSIFFEIIILTIIILILVTGILSFIYRNYKGNYEIIELFIVYSNGCMILHYSNENVHRDETDVDIISGMFTAVQDFTRDSFAHGDVENENWSLKKLEFKGNNIIIERGLYIYIAAVYTGIAGKKLERKLRRVSNKVESDFGDVLKKWQGDLDELKGIHDIIEQYEIITGPKKAQDGFRTTLPHEQPDIK